MSEWREETFLRGSINRLFQLLARILPGGGTLRIMLHRARGVHIGRNVFISEDVILETACPDLITIEDRAWIGIRTIIIAHFRELNEGVRIESDVVRWTRCDHIAECGHRARGGCRSGKCSNTVCAPHDRCPGKSRRPSSPMRGSARDRMSRRKSFPGNSSHLPFARQDRGSLKPCK